jgi:hypothetical protein
VTEIEKNVPFPTDRLTYPFADMDVGDSFLVGKGKRSSVSSNGALFAKKHPGVKFAVRKVEGGDYRCWRIA